MKFHLVLFQLSTYLSITVYVCSLESERIIGDDTNRITHLQPEFYAHHATLFNVHVKNGELLPVLCGASFITRQHVLTAAHCLKEVEWYHSIFVVLPNYDFDSSDHDYSQFHDVSEAYVPANWDFTQSVGASIPYDIGVAKLARELSETEFPSIKALRLPEKGMSLNNRVGLIIGIGLSSLSVDEHGRLTKVGGRQDRKLRFTKYEIVTDGQARLLDRLKCDKDYKLCGYPKEDREPFGILSYGDSGSGFVCDNDLLYGVFVSGQHYNQGITNIGYFANVSYHRAMIDEMVSGNVNPAAIEKKTFQSTDL